MSNFNLKKTNGTWLRCIVSKKKTKKKKTSPATNISTRDCCAIVYTNINATVACHTDIQHINLATQKNSAHWYAGLSKVKLNKDSNRHTYVSNTGP